MKTKSIRYGMTRSLPGFHNVKLEREVELDDGEDPEDALERLRGDVALELGLERHFVRLGDHLRELEDEAVTRTRNINSLKNDYDDLSKEFRKLDASRQKFLNAVGAAIDAGISVPEDLLEWWKEEELPF